MATFYIEAVENTTITLSTVGSPTVGTAKYGIDNISPITDYAYGTDITLTAGQKCYFTITKTTADFSTSNYIKFTSTGNINVGGNISDLNGGETTMSRNFCFCGLFRDCTKLLDASNLVLISNFNNKTNCYQNMFFGCTSLTEAPELPATTLANHCYDSMFRGCTSLTEAPELPATTLAEFCYQQMFDGCTSLIKIPELPATTLAQQCYYGMFYGCSKIKLSTTEVGDYIIPYRIPTIGTGTTASSALSNMFSNTGGTFTGIPEINTTYYLYKHPKVTIHINPENSGTVTGAGEYEEGTTATLTAIPNSIYNFNKWSDDVTTNPRTITVNSDIELTAIFEKKPTISRLELNGTEYLLKDENQSIFVGDGEESSAETIDADLLDGKSLQAILGLIYPVGSIYTSQANTNPATLFGFGTWVKIAEKLPIGENVMGNGKALALSDGTNNGSFCFGSYMAFNANIGSNIGSSPNFSTLLGSNKVVGAPTKAELGATPENSGLIMDTITINVWQRSA